ncbi:MAG: 4Fe-4S dicluster domain-containing protein [Candidatus Krumholzibacteriota bacterium]|nr:4Fe-4S dicluster domain-containing protein [Candidatus Krumholzibacteriota bacterium]
MSKDSAPKNKSKKQSEPIHDMVPIFLMGKKYDVPATLTIQKAFEYAGYQLVRGCGCRGGICGACGTVYRFPDSYRIEVGLACQTVVEPNMYIAQIPFFPANRAQYDLEKLEPTGSTVTALYPEIYKCVGCGTCTRSCPMDIDVMEYISRAIRGDIAGAAELSFDCVMCGLCAARCPAEEAQYNIAILTRRLYGRYIVPGARHLKDAVENIKKKKFEKGLGKLKKMNVDKLKEVYNERETEPQFGPEDWEPENKDYLVTK